jgi:hypothetical protein
MSLTQDNFAIQRYNTWVKAPKATGLLQSLECKAEAFLLVAF